MLAQRLQGAKPMPTGGNSLSAELEQQSGPRPATLAKQI
jgi:hypothetical protein